MKKLIDILILNILKTRKTIDMAEASSILRIVPSKVIASIERLTAGGFIGEQLYNGHARYKLLKKQFDLGKDYQLEVSIVLNELEELKNTKGNLNDLLDILLKLKEANVDLNKHYVSMLCG